MKASLFPVDLAAAAPGSRLRVAWRRASPYVLFTVAWGLLNAIVNARYPGHEAGWWFLVPSVDIVAVLAGYAALARYRRSVPAWLHIALVALLVFVRVFRVADGIEVRYLFRSFNLYTDAQLALELPRLLHSTLSTGRFLLALAGIAALLAGTAVAASLALRYCERFLHERRHVGFFGLMVGFFALLSPFNRWVKQPDQFYGAFAASVLPRLGREADFILHVDDYRSAQLAEIQRVRDELSSVPGDLGKLLGKDVLLFVIESYGVTVRSQPALVSQLAPTYELFEKSLSRHGFAVASSLLDSPTYGGSSWLAHATLATGVRTADQFQYSLLKKASPLTLAGFFKDAGYRTVLVQPATTRPTPGDTYQRFEHAYLYAAFDYKGPRFSYAPMPDQYIVDFIDRRERRRSGQPRFIEYALVSSHIPWTEHAPLIDDWAQIGDGSIYARREKIRLSGAWDNFADTVAAYGHSIAYDLEVLCRYIVERIADESLILIVGDHQPAAQVTLGSPDHGVPIHVISRNRAFVEPFVARGYTQGMRPDPARPRCEMAAFLPGFLRDFSDARTRRPTP